MDRVPVQSLLMAIRASVRARRFDRAQNVLAGFLATEPASPTTAIVESLYRSCCAATEHVRMASELEATAHGHRVAERDLRAAIEGLLASWATAVQLSSWTEPGCGGRRVDRLSAHHPCAAGCRRRNSIRSCGRAVLGPLEVAVDGRWITHWGSLKARALFEYLVFNGHRRVRREVLMETLWPGHTPASARNNLNVCLYTLRRTLRTQRDAQYVVYADGCYALDAGNCGGSTGTSF